MKARYKEQLIFMSNGKFVERVRVAMKKKQRRKASHKGRGFRHCYGKAKG